MNARVIKNLLYERYLKYFFKFARSLGEFTLKYKCGLGLQTKMLLFYVGSEI